MQTYRQQLAAHLANRADLWRDLFIATGDKKYLRLATETERLYRQARRRHM